jgi:hypothetical protein
LSFLFFFLNALQKQTSSARLTRLEKNFVRRRAEWKNGDKRTDVGERHTLGLPPDRWVEEERDVEHLALEQQTGSWLDLFDNRE